MLLNVLSKYILLNIYVKFEGRSEWVLDCPALLDKAHSSWCVHSRSSGLFLPVWVELSFCRASSRHPGASGLIRGSAQPALFPENNASNYFRCFQRACVLHVLVESSLNPGRHLAVITLSSWIKAEARRTAWLGMVVWDPACPVCFCDTGLELRPSVLRGTCAWDHPAERKGAEAGRRTHCVPGQRSWVPLKADSYWPYRKGIDLSCF